jgi:hypothetical protein
MWPMGLLFFRLSDSSLQTAHRKCSSLTLRNAFGKQFVQILVWERERFISMLIFHLGTFVVRIIRAPPYGGCPIVISLSVCACVRPAQMKFSGFFFFYTPFHIGTWNFPWGSSEVSYTSSSRFIIVTLMVPELCALRFFTIGHKHATVFRVFFSTQFHIGTWNFPWSSTELSYTSSSHFIIVTPMVPELCALGFLL